MTLRVSEQRLLSPEDLPPLNGQHDVVGVFNPGAVRVGNGIVLIARVAERPCAQRSGFVGLPRYEPGGELTVDWTPRSRSGSKRPTGGSSEAQRPGAADFRLSPSCVPTIGAGHQWMGTRASAAARIGERGVRHRGPPHHRDRRPLLDYLRRGVAARGGDGPGVDPRLLVVRASRDHLSTREQGCRPVSEEDPGKVHLAAPAYRKDRLLPSRGLAGPVARPAALG